MNTEQARDSVEQRAALRGLHQLVEHREQVFGTFVDRYHTSVGDGDLLCRPVEAGSSNIATATIIAKIPDRYRARQGHEAHLSPGV